MSRKARRDARDLDVFSAERLRTIGPELAALRRPHHHQCWLMWAARLAEAFTDHDLAILDSAGLLCPLDHDYLRLIGRDCQYEGGTFDVSFGGAPAP